MIKKRRKKENVKQQGQREEDTGRKTADNETGCLSVKDDNGWEKRGQAVKY